MLKERIQTCKLPSCDNEVVQQAHRNGGRRKEFCCYRCADKYSENLNSWRKRKWQTVHCSTCGVWVTVSGRANWTYCSPECKPKKRIRYGKDGLPTTPTKSFQSMCECGNEKKPRAIECDRCASMPKVSDILGWGSKE